MKHEDTGYKQERHHKHWHWTNLKEIKKNKHNFAAATLLVYLYSRAVISVEPPHSSTAGSSSPHGATTLGRSLASSLSNSSSCSGRTAPTSPGTASTHAGCTCCWAGHPCS